MDPSLTNFCVKACKALHYSRPHALPTFSRAYHPLSSEALGRIDERQAARFNALGALPCPGEQRIEIDRLTAKSFAVAGQDETTAAGASSWQQHSSSGIKLRSMSQALPLGP